MTSPALLPELRRAVGAEVLAPGSDDYERARSLWNGRHRRRPAAIVRCRTTADVAACVDEARRRDLPLSIRGGGHHVTGDALCDDGLTVDLGAMHAVRVDPEARTAVVGPGTSARALNAATQPFGLATTTAPITTCGMAGYTLGGGLGWISRTHGLACDNLLAAEVVTADGRVVRASEREHADLFWALRGGGGNFGVVTSFEFQLHPVGPQVLSGQIIHRMEDAGAVLRFYRDYMASAPDALACMPVIFQLPPIPGVPVETHGSTVLALVPFHDGDPAAGMELIRPLREFGRPLLDAVGPATYTDLLLELDGMYRPGDRNSYESAFFDSFPDAAIDAFVEDAAPVPSAMSSIFLEWLGGAIARRPVDATAYPHRERRMCLTAVPKWEDAAQDEAMTEWARRLLGALAPYAAPGTYVNYLDRAAAARTPDGGARAAYGANLERLAEVKRRWDPDNLFRQNHNIRPASS